MSQSSSSSSLSVQKQQSNRRTFVTQPYSPSSRQHLTDVDGAFWPRKHNNTLIWCSNASAYVSSERARSEHGSSNAYMWPPPSSSLYMCVCVCVENAKRQFDTLYLDIFSSSSFRRPRNRLRCLQRRARCRLNNNNNLCLVLCARKLRTQCLYLRSLSLSLFLSHAIYYT